MKAVKVSAGCVAMVVGLAWASGAGAATYRVTLVSPPVLSDIISGSKAIPLDFGTNLLSVYRVNVQISGVHSNGWWVGDPAENPVNGPIGGSVAVYLFVGGGIDAPDVPTGGWYEARVSCTNNGAFSSALALRPTAPDLIDGAYVPAGQVGLCLVQWEIGGLGYTDPDPYFSINQVDVQVEDSPVIQLVLNPADGTLSWSGVPSSGSVEILSATYLNGPWQVEYHLPAGDGSVALQWPAVEGLRFFRLRWLEASAP
jgi:hypothetical protein